MDGLLDLGVPLISGNLHWFIVVIIDIMDIQMVYMSTSAPSGYAMLYIVIFLGHQNNFLIVFYIS